MFNISSKYINCPCGLHLDEYQEKNLEDNKLGFYNSKNNFICCSKNKHISRKEYDEVIPQIIDEFIKAGFYKTLNHFSKDINVVNCFNDLKKENINIDKITVQKTKKSNEIIRKYMPHLYETKDYKGNDILTKWNEEILKHAFKLLDKPKYTVNSNFSELLKRIKFNPVTIYSPIMSKCILNKYNCKTVFDPCIGWGGRMLGTCCLDGCHYTGCEPYTKTFHGLKKMSKDLNIEKSIEIYNEPVENVLERLDDKTYDACLTSPPYYNLEIYTDEETQSINMYPTFESWLEKFIDPIIEYVCSHVTKVSCWSVKDINTDNEYNILDNIILLHDYYGWEYIGEHCLQKNVSGKKNSDGDITYIFKKKI